MSIKFHHDGTLIIFSLKAISSLELKNISKNPQKHYPKILPLQFYPALPPPKKHRSTENWESMLDPKMLNFNQARTGPIFHCYLLT